MRQLQKEIHENAVAHGWYDPPPSIPEALAMVHSEVSEALEEYRAGRMETYLAPGGKPEGFPVELADIVIRCLDLAERLGIDLEQMIRIKHGYNKKRPYRHGGKKI